MLANWGSTRVEERRLSEKNEGPVGGESSLRLGNLFKRATNVNGRGPRAFRSSPGNRSTQSIINLEGAGAVTETLQLPAIMRGQLRTCDAKKLSGSDVGENEVSFWELCNFMTDFDAAAKIFQIASEGIRESLSAGAQNRPATGVSGGYDSQANGG
jgi:hypothetical protein